MITVTDKAKEKIGELLKQEGRTSQHNVRVSVKGGGCSGLMHDLDFDDCLYDAVPTLWDALQFGFAAAASQGA